MSLVARLRVAARRFGTSLHVRLVVSFVATGAVVLALVAAATFVRARATLRTQILDRLSAVALVMEGELTLWVDEQAGDLEFVAGLEPVRAAAARIAARAPGAPAVASDTRAIARLLEAARRSSLEMDEVFLLTAVGGHVAASTDSTRVGDYRVTDLFFTNGLNGTSIQNVYASPVTGRPAMTISTPVMDARGRVAAVLAGHLNLSRLDQILAERTGLEASGEAYLVTPFNDFVSARRFGRSDARRGVHSVGVEEALAGRNGGALYESYAGERVLGAWRWIAPRQLALIVEVRAADAFAPARELVLTILAFGAGALLLLTVGVVWTARRIVQPILAVAAAAERVAGGDFDASAPVVTRDEVGVLARTFNDMTARLRELYDDLSEQIGATGRAYRALEESQQLLQAFVDNTTNLIVALDRQGRILLINRRLEELFGVRRGEARGQPPGATLPPAIAAAFEETTRRALEERRVTERDVTLSVDGAAHHYHLVAFPLSQEGRAAFGAGLIGLDLTERVKQEAEHRRLEAGVQQAQKLESLGLLAGGIAHDFNNILTAIVGGASMALDTLEPAAPARADLEQVVVAAERAAKLTRQMLAYAGRASFAIETFDLNHVIREMAELIAISVAKSVRLSQVLGERLAPVRADRTQVSQIVLNLVTNAAEATAARGGTVVVRTRERRADEIRIGEFRFAPAEAPAFVELTVDDDGTGMTPETMEKMFDPFYSTKGSGRGLGLAAVLGIVKQSGGALRVTSRSGTGTTFTVLFPAMPALAAAAAAGVEAARPAAAAGTVLLVDDEDAVRRMTRRALERAGYRVLEATNGKEGVEVFGREAAGLTAVILDVTMPVMDGGEAFRRMRARGPLVPVIVSSGFDQQDAAGAFTGEAVEFLPKPYRPAELLARLRDLGLTRSGRS